MPAANDWTAAKDHRLRWLRFERTSWDVVSAELGFPVSTCMDRARLIGARPAPAVTMAMEDRSDDRRPLPPGHPTTWGLLVQGTVLAGSAYR